MAERVAERSGGTARIAAVLAGSRIRAQWTYRASFFSDMAGQVINVLVSFAEIWVILHNVHSLGGYTLPEVLLVYGLAELAFGIADLAFGQLDGLSNLIRSGKLEVLLVRPVPLLLQLSTLDVQLRRLGRIGAGIVLMVIACILAPIHWSIPHAILLVVAPLAGAAIFSALFVIAGALQFWLINGREFANAFTYGGREVASKPASVFATPMRAFFTFVVPTTLVAYAPSLVLLDKQGPAWLPQELGWLTLPAAILTWCAALLIWRAGVRRYTGAGG